MSTQVVKDILYQFPHSMS